MFKFQKLHVWDKAVEYNVLLLDVADHLPYRDQSSFGDQLKRAALSITNNIAEGSGRKTLKDSNHFFSIAKGSVYETINILIIMVKAKKITLSTEEKQSIYDKGEEICKMLSGLMKNV